MRSGREGEERGRDHFEDLVNVIGEGFILVGWGVLALWNRKGEMGVGGRGYHDPFPGEILDCFFFWGGHCCLWE